MADAYLGAFFKFTGRKAADLLKSTKDGKVALNDLIALLKQVQGGSFNVRGGAVVVDDSGTDPTGTIAVAAASVVADDTITFDYMGGSVVLTAGTDFAVDTSGNSAQAVLLQKAIQAHPLLGSILDVSESSGTLTLTGNYPGTALEAVDMATSNGTAFTLTQIGAVAAGADGAAQFFFQGRHRSGTG